jgi:hypothetical protein
MKHILSIAIVLMTTAFVATAADKVQAGPQGGRLLEKTTPAAEFFLEKDRTATITFYDASMKPVPATEQIVALQADVPAGKQKIEFEKKGDVLASKGKLPEGDAYSVVVQFRSKPDAKPRNYRFNLDTSICNGCKRAEYACTCHE